MPDTFSLEKAMSHPGGNGKTQWSSSVSGILSSQRICQSPDPNSKNVIKRLINDFVVLPEDWDALAAGVKKSLLDAQHDTDTLMPLLVKHRLLSEYQAVRILTGTTFGLVLGNYRVLDRQGAGGMGTVFKAEHIYMRRLAAVKVLPRSLDQDMTLLQRFFQEMRTIAQLQHPNIVTAFDAGRLDNPDGCGQTLYYLVMEFVPGSDLEQYVIKHGPFTTLQACDLVYQISSALVEAQKHQLVHRDIKPSNIILTAEQKAKLLDFGLARCFNNRMTEPGTVVGTVDFLAPEQAKDSSQVDVRTDIYSLGATLYWFLTGELPFPSGGNMAADLAGRFEQTPPSIRKRKPEISVELEAFIQKMMALDPNDRFPTPEAVQRALLPFLKPETPEHLFSPPAVPIAAARQTSSDLMRSKTQAYNPEKRRYQLLIVDDEKDIRELCRVTLQSDALECETASDGVKALEMLELKRFDLALLDVKMPRMSGLEVVKHIREKGNYGNLKVILFSGHQTPDELSVMLTSGVDDYLMKPFSIVQLRNRIQAALRLKDLQDRSEWLNHYLIKLNGELEYKLQGRRSDVVESRNALVLALAQLVEYREDEGGTHLRRMQLYCRRLAEEAAELPAFAAGTIDPDFIEQLECCVPLHDIGKVALPDHIRLKPGKLEPEERLLMQTHTVTGGVLLKRISHSHGESLSFLGMTADIARHHHERYDGNGYPDQLKGDDIPLAARIASIADVYDALRTPRLYKPALSHAAAVQVLSEISTGHFDPVLLQAFHRCAADWERIFQNHCD